MTKKIGNLLTKSQKEHVESIVDEKVRQINYLMGGVVLVLFIGFVTLLFALGALVFQVWQFTSPSYQGLYENVKILNDHLLKEGKVSN